MKDYNWKEIQEIYDTGLSLADMKLHGISRSALSYGARNNLFKPRTKSESRKIARNAVSFDWDAIQKDYDSGLSFRNISAKYHISCGSLVKASKRGDLVARSRKESHAVLLATGWRPSGPCEEAREALSRRQIENHKGGFCKWYDVHGQRVQGTWERDAGLKLTEIGIEWRKCAGLDDMLSYVLDGRSRRYLPDFYIPEYDLYLEFKGYWWGDDRRKMDAVLEQHPEVNIAILEKEQYLLLLNGEYALDD